MRTSTPASALRRLSASFFVADPLSGRSGWSPERPAIRRAWTRLPDAASPAGWLAVPLAVLLAGLLTSPAPAWAQTDIFDPDADYRILTFYGAATDIVLADYLANGVSGVTFSLESCDASQNNYYQAAAVAGGKLTLTSNTLGHVHGTNTESETVCTVTGTLGADSESQEFELYTVSDRTPSALAELSLAQARAAEVDIRIMTTANSGYIRLGWRKAGTQPTFRVVSGVTSGSVLTIPSLEAGAEHEIRGYQLTRQSFDLYRAGNSGADLQLIPEGRHTAKWRRNLSSDGLSKPATLEVETLTEDLPPTVGIGDATVTEARGAEAVFTVTLSGLSSRVVTVRYATSNRTAEAGADYTATSGTLSIPAGAETGMIRVPVLDDDIDEPEEHFTVILSSPTNASIDDGEGEGTIVDDETEPSLTIDDVMVVEAPDAEAVFTVTLSTQSSRDVTVGYQTSNGAAEAGQDYTATSGVLTITAGNRTGSIRVPVLDDDIDEPDEDFNVVLTNPANATLADDRGVGTITEDDLPPTVGIGDATVTEALDAEAVFTVTLSGLSSRVVTVRYATSNRTAEAGADYTATSGTLSIPAGAETGMIRVPVLDDDIDEPEEHFTVILSSPTNASIDDGEGEGTIVDDETEPSLAIDDVMVVEARGAEAVFTVTLSGPSSSDVAVGYATSDGDAKAASDYTATSGVLTIPAGFNSGSIRVPVLDDEIAEPDENFKVTLDSPSNATINDEEGEAVIADNEATPALRIGDATVTEAPDAEAVFTVTLSTQSSRDVTVGYQTSNGAAEAGQDYTATSGVLTITAGNRTGSIRVPVLDDDIDEPDEDFNVVLTNPANATLADDRGVGTITEDDLPPTVGIGDATVTEARGAEAVFTVTLSGLSSRVVTVRYATSNRTAEAGADYTATSGTLSIPAGAETGMIRVPVLDDDIDEPEEHFTVILSSPTNASIDDGEGEGTIVDDETEPSLTIDDVMVVEARGAEAVFTVTLSGPSSSDVAVGYATSDGDAKAASDYTATSGVLTIPAGFNSGSIRVPVLDDEIAEPDENFKVTLDSPSNATINDEEGEAVIADNEATPALRIGDATVTEAPDAEAVFTVTLSAKSSRDVTVGYQTSNGAAEAGQDYTATSGVLTITAGNRTGSIRVPVLNDDIDEPDEDFNVVLTNPANATLADDRGVGTITEDDLPPTVGIGDATVTEARGAEAVFTVTLSGLSSRVVTVRYATSNRTAEAGADYTATSGTLSIPAGAETGMIRVPVLDDDIDEPEEHFTVILSSPTNASIDDGEGEGTIVDDETEPSLTIDDVMVVEARGAEAVFTVTLSGPSSSDVAVGYATSDGDATAASDYSATSGVLNIPAGNRMGTIRVPVLDDDVDEPDEDFNVVLTNPANAILADDRGVGTITGKEPETPPGPISRPPTLNIGDATVVEGPGAVAEFTVTLSAAATDAVTVDYATSDGTAQAGLDYTSSSGALTIPAGETSGTIRVSVLDDTIDEPDETFTVTLSRAANATIEDGDGAGTIEDGDDEPPTLTIDDATVTEGPGAVAEFTVTLSAAATDAVTVDYATSDGTARAGLDYTSSSGALTIPAGTTSGTIRVSVLDDTIDEPDETFAVTLSRAANATIEDGDGTGTITDDDKPPALTIDDVTVTEGPGAVAEFTVMLSAAATDAVTVDYATSDGTARASLDYASSKGALTIPAGGTSGTIRVSVLDDTIDEPDETFAVTLSRAANATIEDGDGTGTITDDDKPPALTIDDVTVTEGPGVVAEFTVTLSTASGKTITVEYATADRTALAQLDYNASRGTLILPAGRTTGTVRAPVLDDALDELDETFAVTLHIPANATLKDAEGLGTIIDDDDPAVTVSYGATRFPVREGGEVVVDVVLNARPERRIVVPLTQLRAEGAAVADYAGIPATVLFGPSETRTTFTVVALEDTEYEGEEEVLLGFGSLPKHVSAADPETAVLVIADVYVPDREKDDWLDPFGRTVAGHVLEALDDRLRCAPDRRPEETPADETASARQPEAARPGRWRCKPPYRPGVSATAPTDRPGNSFGREEGELLAGSSFDARTETEDGRRLSVWGRGAFTRFDRHRGELALSGDVTTATLGTDYSGDRWLAGAALSHSRGEGIVSQGKFEAEARSDLSGLYPYVRYGVREGLSIWGVAGHGRGTLTLSWKDAEPVDYRIATVMGAAGMNSELRSATEENDFALTLKADALFLRTFSERLPDGETSETDATRFRLALEGSWDFTTEDEKWFSPFLEAGLRHDEGRVETGLGLEVGGGFRHAHPGLNLTTELGARGLFTDESGAFEEWGVWGSFRYDPYPSSQNGPSVEVSPSFGAANAGGVHALWQQDTMAGHAAGGFDSHRGRIETELAYGLPVFGNSGTGTPLIGMSTSDGPTDYRVGYRLTLGSTLEVSVEAALRRNRRFNTPSTFGVLVHGALRW